MPILQTQRLRLRQLTAEDAPFVLKLVNDPSWLQYIGDRGVRNLEDARHYILNGPVESYRVRGFGLYLVELEGAKIPIGLCGLIKRPELEDVDLGFALLPEFTGKGYALEAAAAVLEQGHAALGIDRIVAIATPGNERSIRLLEKLGFRFERMIAFPPKGERLKLFASHGSKGW
jgi:RimJ/RimL family protein N-acetyltransferase